MNTFNEIAPSALPDNVFTLIGKEWMLVTAGSPDNHNTMTASWGGLGVLWNKNVATIYIRPQRHTYGFIENSDYFSIAFFDESYRSTLTYCGRNSGRDVNKAEECKLTPIALDNTTAFAQARLVLTCKKLYHSDIDPQNFHDDTLSEHYNNDYHRMYIAEIVKAYVAK